MQNIDFKDIPLAPEHCVQGFGTTVVIAPHADDESLGCGGMIALLRKYNLPVYIVLLSDGTLSHPNSEKYPAEKLRDLRESELISAAEILGVAADKIVFCRYRDRGVPDKENENFSEAVQSLTKLFGIIQPQSVFVPWRRDPHPDHRAAFQLVEAADYNSAKIYEYPIWLTELGEDADLPNANEAMPFRLKIESVLDKKTEAIYRHQSQISNLIDDDPDGFQLSEDMLNQFKVPFETFFISK